MQTHGVFPHEGCALFCILQLGKNMLLQLDGSQFPSPPGLDAPFSRNIEEGNSERDTVQPLPTVTRANERIDVLEGEQRFPVAPFTEVSGGRHMSCKPRIGAAPLPVVRPVVAQSRQRPAHRLRVMTYNIGGFLGETYAVFCRWLTTQTDFDIITVQETHRGRGRNEGRWQVGSWTVVSPRSSMQVRGSSHFLSQTALQRMLR